MFVSVKVSSQRATFFFGPSALATRNMYPPLPLPGSSDRGLLGLAVGGPDGGAQDARHGPSERGETERRPGWFEKGSGNGVCGGTGWLNEVVGEGIWNVDEET